MSIDGVKMLRLGIPRQNDGKDDGKTQALRVNLTSIKIPRQRLTEAVDD
jgi:hypothetical protein